MKKKSQMKYLCDLVTDEHPNTIQFVMSEIKLPDLKRWTAALAKLVGPIKRRLKDPIHQASLKHLWDFIQSMTNNPAIATVKTLRLLSKETKKGDDPKFNGFKIPEIVVFCGIRLLQKQRQKQSVYPRGGKNGFKLSLKHIYPNLNLVKMRFLWNAVRGICLRVFYS